LVAHAGTEVGVQEGQCLVSGEVEAFHRLEG
jgi:hypothetical protein